MADGERLRVTLVEPWFTGSHRAWAEGYQRASGHRVRLVTHPGAHWKWRMLGAPLTLARRLEQLGDGHDVLLVSGMVHLPALLGLARRAVGAVPVVLYLHENQLTYPSQDGGDPDLTYPLVNWLSMAAADEVWVATDFHREALLEALPPFLARFPDPSHLPALDEVASRCRVVPVGLDVAGLVTAPRRSSAPTDGPLVLWNHRWEHDKAPERFAAAATRLADDGERFRVALAGQRFRTRPAALEECRARLGDRIVHDDFADRERYRELLLESDVVVSTARHEFFGMAVVEAVAAGAVPVVPDALSYRELFPADCRYGDDRELVELLGRVVRAVPDATPLRAAAARFDWSAVAPAYDDALSALARSRGRRGRGASG